MGQRPAMPDRDSSLPPPGQPLRVIVVESEAEALNSTLAQELRRQGYLAEAVTTGVHALEAHRDADLVLLDLDLPDLDGLEVCRRIRAAGAVPIITVTARGTELDRVLGLRAGADDYIVKPYGLQELLARMEAVLRRSLPRRVAAQPLVHGPLRLDGVAREVLLDDRRIDLTPKEFDLLHLLLSQPGATVTRRELMSRVWGEQWSTRGRTLDTHVSSLRGKLGSNGWIVTVRGVGFRLGRP